MNSYLVAELKLSKKQLFLKSNQRADKMAKSEGEIALAIGNFRVGYLIAVLCLLAIGCGGEETGKPTDTEVGQAMRELAEEREKNRIASLREQIAEMELKKGEAEAARKLLNKLVVSEAELIHDDPKFIGSIFRFTVQNGLPVAVSEISISYKTMTPGRSVPWDSRNTRHEIPGGLEPGESRTIGFSYSGNAPSDREINIEVELNRAKNASGETIADATVFDPDRLMQLRDKLADATKSD